MFFSFVRSIILVLVWILNGKFKVIGKENLPQDDNYILIAPHRSWIDPVYLVLATTPKQFSVMAKKELFKNPVFRWIITHMNAFPVDRDNPGPSAIKTPVKSLKETDLGLLIFPSGTRHSNELKGGAVTIAKLSKKPIVPAVYSGPLTFSDLVKRKKAVVRIGEPFYVERKVEGIKDTNAYYSEKIQQAFEELDRN
ncbi:1-acyl-sn-glycerol-3-phosphate acyltransferase [Alkalibacterium putridalgicola]|uniref:1-acyl-sn-glycerol-3-phosphate acyltransferase n=1 Tax=Alkalibacterium putridalgicola TaxID=426703 RepID=A0A1H7PUR3_9LACT|nr:1-acyl-sn-glycerol-3-phosphate acyltransferase [Alkalibacterium putridalgicola]GEK88136.1 1-acyl-sn-glycerol-3-phosphate acyltransferase [Alkalibacterium putridalgicola]SEL39631.1 1-acyl-sn-glycerol-3-phosphate acyltransferase [Alkalibacterium putridalgicola]